jgi:CheY-like chemotaxis protein
LYTIGDFFAILVTQNVILLDCLVSYLVQFYYYGWLVTITYKDTLLSTMWFCTFEEFAYVPRIRGGHMKIGILEDDSTIRGILKEMLEHAGHTPATYENGWDFLLDIFEDEHTPKFGVFDVVLIDLVLPSISGAEVLNTLTSAYPSLPVIIISASSNDYLASIRRRYPHVKILQKPFRFQELLDSVAQAVS